MNFQVKVWGLDVEGTLAEYDYTEGVCYDLDEIEAVGFRHKDGSTAWLPDEAVARLVDWSEFAEAVLEAALDDVDHDDS